jgi:hypothetical protein
MDDPVRIADIYDILVSGCDKIVKDNNVALRFPLIDHIDECDKCKEILTNDDYDEDSSEE